MRGSLLAESCGSCFTSRCMLSELARCRLQNFPHGRIRGKRVLVDLGVDVGASQNQSRFASTSRIFLLAALAGERARDSTGRACEATSEGQFGAFQKMWSFLCLYSYTVVRSWRLHIIYSDRQGISTTAQASETSTQRCAGSYSDRPFEFVIQCASY